MMSSWAWLLLKTGITAKIKALETKIVHTQDVVRQRDEQIVKLHKIYAASIDARDTWRNTAIKYRKTEQFYKDKLEKMQAVVPQLIRFDPIKTSHGTYGMVSDTLGEYVKYKALESLFLEA